MAYRRKTATIDGDCVEKIQFHTPENVWVDHPTRGGWAPCGTYPPLRMGAGGLNNHQTKSAKWHKSAVNMNNGSVFIASKSLVRYAPTLPLRQTREGNTMVDISNTGSGSMTSEETDKLKKLGLMVLLFVGGYFVIKKFL